MCVSRDIHTSKNIFSFKTNREDSIATVDFRRSWGDWVVFYGEGLNVLKIKLDFKS